MKSNEVKSSYWLELEGVIGCLKEVEEEGVVISDLVTDRHSQVKAYMKKERTYVNQRFDMWHVAKGNSVCYIIVISQFPYRYLILLIDVMHLLYHSFTEINVYCSWRLVIRRRSASKWLIVLGQCQTTYTGLQHPVMEMEKWCLRNFCPSWTISPMFMRVTENDFQNVYMVNWRTEIGLRKVSTLYVYLFMNI